jgi:tRNA threonylcarbamoyladenosine biosynthesis protein TsaB
MIMGERNAKNNKQWLILAVDTTTPTGSVALLRNTKLIAEFNQDSATTFSERLLPAVHLMLKSCGMMVQDIHGFAVAVGPGSFTGIRIGLSTIKSFAYASGKPVAPVSTLTALAMKLLHSHRLICPLIDAKKKEIYAALFESRQGILKEIIPQGAYSPDAFFSRLPSHRIIDFIGSGRDVFGTMIINYFKDKARFSKRSPYIAFEVGLIGYDLLKRNKGKDFQEIEPLYLRKSQAEEKH